MVVPNRTRYDERDDHAKENGMSAATLTQRPIGELLRQWREHRRLSQLELALRAEISTRHLSFVETGRSAPSREMIVNLSDQLDLTLRERNRLLLSAGFAPVYTETPLDSPQMAVIRDAVRQVLAGHEPYPAAAFDRHYNLVEANAGIALFTDGIDPDMLKPPVNVLRLALHPNGLAPRTVNLGEWRAHLLGGVQRQIATVGDPKLVELLRELSAYPCEQPEPDISASNAIVIPLRIRRNDGRELALLSTVTTFGTPLDITIAELGIESFFPADAESAALLRG
jgi:transcriptional regulator with XRE-family HTH domain